MAIPAALLVGLWGYAATGLVADRSNVQDDTSLATSVEEPGYQMLGRLQIERRLTASFQADRSEATQAALEKARGNTDTAIENYRRSSESAVSGKDLQDRVKPLEKAVIKLSENRSAIDRRTLSSGKAFQYYSDTISDLAAVIEVAARPSDKDLARAGDAATNLLGMAEMLSREDALLSGAIAAGKLTESERSQFAQYAAIQRHIRAALLHTDDLPGDQAAAYERLVNDPQFKSLTSIEDAVTNGAGSRLPKEANGWRIAADTIDGGLRDIGGDSFEALAAQGSDRADELLMQFVLGSLAVIAALLVTGVLMRRVAGSASHRLTRLLTQIEELGEQRLPEFLAQLDRGDPVEDDSPLPTADPDADELERLGVAVNRLGRHFEAALVRQARGREGTEKVFANLTRRTQILVHRLISLLDDLERKHEDSDLLQDIFKVDHLATRVRRHSENLVILGGSSPGRRGIRPLSITDVVRGAVSETEQYRRVTVQSLPPGRQVMVAARAVTDITHLLAELIENGTTFSPPDTQVQISARKVARGLALHVEDRGLGMPSEQYGHLNELLTKPPQPDMDALGKDPRLGLFVVAKLAERHGLKVSLRESDYGGTLAVVLVPASLLEEHESSLPKELKQAAGLVGGSSPASSANGSAPAGLADSAPLRFPEVSMAERRTADTPPSTAAPSSPRTPGVPSTPNTPRPDTRRTPSAPSTPAVPAAATAPAASAAPAVPEIIGTHATTTPPQFETHGFPDYGGAGLLPPSSEETDAAGPPTAWSPVQEHTDSHTAPQSESYGEPHPEHYGEPYPRTYGQSYAEPHIEHVPASAGLLEPSAGHMESSAGLLEPSAGHPEQQSGPLDEPHVLPTRTRGASLARQLREEAGPARSGRENVEEEVSTSFTPGRSAANMMAIQRETRRARESQASRSAELDGPAESRQHGTDEL